jgi:hypothetical protein
MECVIGTRKAGAYQSGAPLCALESWGLYYTTLQTCNVRQTDRFCYKLMLYIVDRKHINFVKHASLLRIP